MCFTVLEPLDQLASPEPHASHLREPFAFWGQKLHLLAQLCRALHPAVPCTAMGTWVGGWMDGWKGHSRVRICPPEDYGLLGKKKREKKTSTPMTEGT